MERARYTVLTHFEELRRRLIVFVAVLFGLWCVLFGLFPHLVPFLLLPYERAFPGRELELVFTTLPEAVVAALKATFFLALALSLPVLLFQTWRFLSPALYPRERRVLLRVLVLVSGLSLGGIALAYFLVLPALLRLFLGLGYAHFAPYLRVQSYLAFLGKGLLVAALVSQIPALVALLARAELLPRAPRRRLLYLAAGAYAVALFLSPADVVSQVILAAALYGLFELGFWLARFV